MHRLGTLAWGALVALALAPGCDCGSKSKRAPPAGGSVRSAPTRTAPPPATLLDRARGAAGGANMLRRASSFRASFQLAPAVGPPEGGTLWYRPGAARLKVETPAEGRYELRTHAGGCDLVYGKVVVPCSDRRSKMESRYHIAWEASWLWSLAGPGWSVRTGTAVVDDQDFDMLIGRKKGLGFDATLFVDRTTHLVRRIAVPIEDPPFGRQRVGVRSQFEDACGAKLPRKVVDLLGDETLSTTELSDVRCEAVEAADVAVPAQVADGTVEERSIARATLLCHTVPSSYRQIGKRFDALDRQRRERSLRRRREIAWVWFTSPPEEDVGAAEVTEICFEVAAPEPTTPVRTGAFVLRSEPSHRVVTAYGVGPYEAKLKELAATLGAERSQRSIPDDAPVRQLGYMVAQDAPDEMRVSELQIVLPDA